MSEYLLGVSTAILGSLDDAAFLHNVFDHPGSLEGRPGGISAATRSRPLYQGMVSVTSGLGFGHVAILGMCSLLLMARVTTQTE